MEFPTTDSDDSSLNSLFRMELGFFEVLKMVSRRTKVYLVLPETFIFGFGFPQPTLLCTDYATGELHIRENISKAGVYEACEFFEDLTNTRSATPVTVHKLAATTYFKDASTPQFSASEAFSLWTKYASMSRAQVLQRYVCGGFLRPSLTKAVWTGEAVHKQEFTNLHPVLSHSTTEGMLKHCSESPSRDELRRKFLVLTHSDLVKCADVAVSHSIDSKMRYLVALLEKYYLPSADFKIARLEVDFMQDRKGVSYMIAVKDFKLVRGVLLAPEVNPKDKVKKRKLPIVIHKPVTPPKDQPAPSFVKLPAIRQWNKAIQKQKEIVSLMEARERAKLNKTMLC